MDRTKTTVVATLLGIFYAYLSVYIIGFGAAIAIPASLLTPIAELDLILAFAMADIITIAIPLIIVYFIFVFTVKYFNSSNSYLPFLALLAPFCIQHIYFWINIEVVQDLAYVLSTTMPRYILIIFFALYFVKQASEQQ
jgi:hypothetical protein